MKKLLFIFFFMLVFGALTMAQEGKPQKFKLSTDSFSTELVFEANPVSTEEITVNIYATNVFKDDETPLKFSQKYTINRGVQTIKIDTSSLPAGIYDFDIVQSVRVQKINRNVTRCVYSKQIRKD